MDWLATSSYFVYLDFKMKPSLYFFREDARACLQNSKLIEQTRCMHADYHTILGYVL